MQKFLSFEHKMPYFDFRLTIEGVEEVGQRISYIGSRIKDFTEPLKEIGEYMLKAFNKNFTKQGSHFQQRWQDLAPSTIADKIRKGYDGQPPMVRTGKLRDNFRYKIGGGLLGALTGSKNQITLYNETPYFKYHQSNKPRTSNLPRRVMMATTERERKQIAQYFNKYLNKLGKKR